MKKQRGITLVALLITIVVLVILAGISIASIQNNNIIGQADSAATQFKEEQKSENTFIASYDSILEKYNNNNNKNTIDSNNTNNNSTTYFTIKETSSGRTTTYNFVAGQTWNEYIQNSDKFNPYFGNNIYYEHSSEVACAIQINGKSVHLNDPIVNGGLYTYEHVDGEWGPLKPL